MPLDDFELREVIEFSFARKHIEIKHPERLARGGIGHHVKLEIVDPFVRRGDLLELQAEDALINGEHAIEHFLEREKCAQRFLIDGVFLFVQLVVHNSASPTPRSSRWDRLFQRPSSFVIPPLRFKLGLNSGDQIADVLRGVRTSLGHFDFGLIVVPRFVTEPQRNLVAKGEHLVEQR